MTQFKNILVIGSSGVGKKNWVNILQNNPFMPMYLPLVDIEEHQITLNNSTFNLILMPGQKPYMLKHCISVFDPLVVIIFIDVTSLLSYKKGRKLKGVLSNLGLNCHFVFNKNDIQGYNNNLGEMILDIPCSSYSVISARLGTNIHEPIIKCIELISKTDD